MKKQKNIGGYLKIDYFSSDKWGGIKLCSKCDLVGYCSEVCRSGILLSLCSALVTNVNLGAGKRMRRDTSWSVS